MNKIVVNREAFRCVMSALLDIDVQEIKRIESSMDIDGICILMLHKMFSVLSGSLVLNASQLNTMVGIYDGGRGLELLKRMFNKRIFVRLDNSGLYYCRPQASHLNCEGMIGASKREMLERMRSKDYDSAMGCLDFSMVSKEHLTKVLEWIKSVTSRDLPESVMSRTVSYCKSNKKFKGVCLMHVMYFFLVTNKWNIESKKETDYLLRSMCLRPEHLRSFCKSTRLFVFDIKRDFICIPKLRVKNNLNKVPSDREIAESRNWNKDTLICVMCFNKLKNHEK